jgi:hypothetical protein
VFQGRPSGRAPATAQFGDPLRFIAREPAAFAQSAARRLVVEPINECSTASKKKFSASAHRQGRRRWSFRQALWRPPVGANPLQVQSALHPPLLGSAPVGPCREYSPRSRLLILFEGRLPLDRNVDGVDCDGLALQHGRTKERTTLSLIPRLTGSLFLPRAPVFRAAPSPPSDHASRTPP